jgi:hypothetical protein
MTTLEAFCLRVTTGTFLGKRHVILLLTFKAAPFIFLPAENRRRNKVIVIAVLSAIAVIAAILFLPVRRRLSIRRHRLPFGLLGATIILLGLILIVFNLDRLNNLWESRSWPATAAKVVRTALIREGRVYGPLVVYSYEVNGRIYVDSSHVAAPGFGGKRKRYDAAERILNDFHQDSLITVRYDPANAAVSTLHPGPPWNVYGQLGLGSTLFAAGLFLLLLITFGRQAAPP